MKSADVDQWLEKILTVKHENAISGLVQQLKWATELEIFLQKLESKLREIVSIGGSTNNASHKIHQNIFLYWLFCSIGRDRIYMYSKLAAGP